MPPRTDPLATFDAIGAAPTLGLRSKVQRLPRSMRVLVTQVVLATCFIGGWELAARWTWIDPFFFPPPSAIGLKLVSWFSGPGIWTDIGVTMMEIVLSYITGVVGGVVFGIWLGLAPFAASVLQPFVKIMNAVPRLVLAPIFIIWFGLGLLSKVAVGFTIVFFIAFFNTLQGVREVSPVVLANARLLKASRLALLRHVYLPSAASWILSSLRVSIGLAVIGAIVSEYLGSSAGIGYRIAQADGLMDATGVFAGLILLSAFVVILDAAVDWLERRMLVWRRN